MRRNAPPPVRELHTVFVEFFSARAREFMRDQPSPVDCLRRIRDAITLLKGYEEGIAELIANERANAKHRALPCGWPLRITRDHPIA